MQANPISQTLQLATNISKGHAPPPAWLCPDLEQLAAQLQQICGSELRLALERILCAERGADALEWLQQTSFLALVLPELTATVGFVQEEGRLHKDVWKHTKQVLAQAPQEIGLRWAALLHDIGKVPTRAIITNKVTFHGHAEVGARMFYAIARRLQFPKPLQQRVHFLILHHQRISHYCSDWTDSAVRRFYRKVEPHLSDLIALSRADVTSARPEKRRDAARQLDQLEQRIKALQELDQRQSPLPQGMGTLIMQYFDLPEGRTVGQAKQALLAAIADGLIRPYGVANEYLEYLAQHWRAEEGDR